MPMRRFGVDSAVWSRLAGAALLKMPPVFCGAAAGAAIPPDCAKMPASGVGPPRPAKTGTGGRGGGGAGTFAVLARIGI